MTELQWWNRSCSGTVFAVALAGSVAMAGKPAFNAEPAQVEAVYLGDSYLPWAPQAEGGGDTAYRPVAFYTTAQSTPGPRLVGMPAGEIVYLLLRKNTKIAVGSIGTLDFISSTAPGWAAFDFEKFTGRRRAPRSFVHDLAASENRNAIYAAAVLEKNGVDLGETTASKLMRDALGSTVLSEPDYAWLLFITQRAGDLRAWAADSDLGKAYWLFYLLTHGTPAEALEYLHAQRGVLREVLAQLHNRNLDVYAPVSARKLDAGVKHYRSQGNPVVDLDLTVVVELELALRTDDIAAVHALVKQAFERDPDVTDALTPNGRAQLKPWVMVSSPLFTEVCLVPGLAARAVAQLQKHREYRARLADHSDRALLDLRVFLSQSPDAVAFDEAWDVLVRRFYGARAEDNLELLEIALRTGHATEGMEVGHRMVQDGSMRRLAPGNMYAARFYLLLAQLELLTRDYASFDARIADPAAHILAPYRSAERVPLSPEDERSRCILAAARAFTRSDGGAEAAASELVRMPHHETVVASWKKGLEAVEPGARYAYATQSILWTLPALARMPEFVRFIMTYARASR